MNVFGIIASMALAGWLALTVTAASRPRRPRAERRVSTRRGGWPSRLQLAFDAWRANRQRAQPVDPAALASWADDLARTLRHGSTLRAALADVVPTDAVLHHATDRLRHRLARGATVTESCDAWSVELQASRAPRRELLATLAAVLAAAAQLGGSTATPLDRFAVAMRERTSDDLERAAQSAQAKLSARVLTWVPLIVLAVLIATDPDVRQVITQASGAAAVGSGLALNAAGSFWMRAIVNGSGAR